MCRPGCWRRHRKRHARMPPKESKHPAAASSSATTTTRRLAPHGLHAAPRVADEWEADGELTIRPIDFKDHLPTPPALDGRVPQFPALVAAVARPGEGKSTVVANMLLNPKIWRGFFHRIYLFSPTARSPQNSWEALELRPERVTTSYSDAKLDAIVADVADSNHERTLIIFDDLQGDPVLYARNGTSSAMRLAMNHRHYGGGITMLFIVQSYSALPAKLRPKITDWLFFGGLDMDTIKQIASEVTDKPPAHFRSLLMRALDRPHSFLYVHRGKDGRLTYRKRFGEVLRTAQEILGGDE